MRIGIIGAHNHRALAQPWRLVRALPEGVTIVSCGADGVDTVSALAARQRGLAVEEHRPAECGPLAMSTTIATTVEELHAFPWPEGRGTWDTVRKAQAAGIPVHVHEPDVEHPALLVFSARIAYGGRGAFSVMRRGPQEGWPFAPTEQLLQRALAAREQARKLRDAATELRGQQRNLWERPDDFEARGMRATSLDEQAEQIEANSWAHYRPRYVAEMRVSCDLLTRGSPAWARRQPEDRQLHEEAWERGARPHPEAWRRLLAKSFVVICCACVDRRRCHRTILRAEILPAFGAVDGGEVPCR